MTAVAVTVTRTLERVALLRDRAAAVVIRYTMTPKTMENVRAICSEKTGELYSWGRNKKYVLELQFVHVCRFLSPTNSK